MAFEIERKFLVRDESWRAYAGRATFVRQAYLLRNGTMSLRIRIKDNARATLTIKPAASEISRLEFEYEIPLADASRLLDLRQGGLIEKLRHELPQDGLTWEIDMFQGENQGLVIAEIELPHEDIMFRRPQWRGPEITADARYCSCAQIVPLMVCGCSEPSASDAPKKNRETHARSGRILYQPVGAHSYRADEPGRALL